MYNKANLVGENDLSSLIAIYDLLTKEYRSRGLTCYQMKENQDIFVYGSEDENWLTLKFIRIFFHLRYSTTSCVRTSIT